MGTGPIVVVTRERVDELLQGISEGKEAYAAAKKLVSPLACVAPDHPFPLTP